MKTQRTINALKAEGPLGETVASVIENQRTLMHGLTKRCRELSKRCDIAERQVRDQAREIERLNRRLRELETGPERHDYPRPMERLAVHKHAWEVVHGEITCITCGMVSAAFVAKE